jgi:hypothetical protein
MAIATIFVPLSHGGGIASLQDLIMTIDNIFFVKSHFGSAAWCHV